MATAPIPQENDRRHSEDAAEGELEQSTYTPHPHAQDAAEGPDGEDGPAGMAPPAPPT